MNKQRKSLPVKVIGLLMLTGVALCLFLGLRKPKAQREDFENMLSREYDLAFLSMYPVSTYSDEDFLTYFGVTPFKASYCIPSFSVMEQYMKQIVKSGNPVATVYLGIRPDKANAQEMQALAGAYPSIAFEIILSYPSADYWRSLSERAYKEVLGDYSDFLLAASGIPNAHLFFHGSQEWLIGNPANYRQEWLANESIASTILLTSTVYDHNYITPENAMLYSQALENLTREIRTAQEDLPDLSDHCLIFFGDSVIGNYTDTASIPGVVSGLAGAAVYNCGFGGGSASSNPESDINLPSITEAFAQGDLSFPPKDSQLYQGMNSYASDSTSDKKLCFVINYGLNDYFKGWPVSSEGNPYDPATFCGAIRTAVATLRSSYQDAQIILCTPSYCKYFENGTEPHGAEGYVLNDYVEAVASLSQELQVDLLDTYHGFEIDDGNWDAYLLPDQVHPNAAYRYLIGEQIIGLVR